MKTIKSFIAVALAVVTAFPMPSRAATKADVTVGTEVFMGDQDNAKFREYRYRTKDPVGGFTKLSLESEPSESRFYKVGLDARTSEDVNLRTETGSYGKYKVGIGFKRMGHNFAFGAKTIYAGVGTGTLTIDDATQTYLQNTSTTSVTLLTNKLKPIVANGWDVDLALRRDKVNMDFAWNVAKPVAVTLGADYEKRKGTRPYMSGFGFGNSIELAEPIDFDTSNFREGVEYHTKTFHASLDHSLSLFNNANSSLTFDNPFRGTDNTNASAYTANVLYGPKMGRNSLAPDNLANHVNASIAQALPWKSRLAVTAGFGWLRQNDRLLPQTTNTAITGSLAVPRDSAQAKVDTRLYTARLISSPLKKLHLKADYRYDQHDNNTEVFTNNRWVVADANTYASGAKSSDYVSVIKRVAEFETAYDVMDRTAVSAAVENEHETFDGGSSNKMNTNAVKLSVDTHKIKWTDLRLTVEHSARRADYPNYTALELPWMRKYYAASRDRNQAILMATVVPNDKLTTGVEYIYGVDDYPASDFGLRYSRHHSVSVDIDYALNSRVTVSPSYTFEYYNSIQKSRQWNPAGAGDPYTAAYSQIESANNWTVRYLDVIQTPALNVGVVVVPEKLDFNATGLLALANNKRDFESAIGTTANDTNAYAPQDSENADDKYMIQASGKFDYKVKPDFSVGLGYMYQRLALQDNLLYDGYNRVATAGNGSYNSLLTMDTLYRSYNVHEVFVTASYKF